MKGQGSSYNRLFGHGPIASYSGPTMRHALGPRVADPPKGPDPQTLLDRGSAPEGASTKDKAQPRWTNAWARQNTTRAGKAERKSALAGSQKGAVRGQKYIGRENDPFWK